MKHVDGNRVGKSILAKAMIALFAVGVIACNANEKSGIKVAGGTIDGSATEGMLYPATVYVDMTGMDYLTKLPSTIRNVGTIVDMGLPGDKVALIVSLADIFRKDASGQYAKDEKGNPIPDVPLFKSVTLKIYSSGNKPPVVLSDLTIDENTFNLSNSYRIYSVGVKATKTGQLPNGGDAVFEKATNALLLDSPIDVPYISKKGEPKNLSLRTPETAYQFMAIPKSALAGIATSFPKLVPADQRAEYVSSGKVVMVGFGENRVAGETGRKLALSEELPAVNQRNYIDVTPLNLLGTEPTTPLGKILKSSPAAKQIWEVSGSGLCGTTGKGNYDTGAAIYSKPRSGPPVFLGFAVRSTATKSNYLGMLQCNGSIDKEEMVTVIVSPSAVEIQQFKDRVPAQ